MVERDGLERDGLEKDGLEKRRVVTSLKGGLRRVVRSASGGLRRKQFFRANAVVAAVVQSSIRARAVRVTVMVAVIDEMEE